MSAVDGDLTDGLWPALEAVCHESGRPVLELAAVAGSSRSELRRIFSGSRGLRLDSLDRILVAAGATYGDLDRERYKRVASGFALLRIREPPGSTAGAPFPETGSVADWDPRRELGEAIRAARKKKGWSQAGLALRAQLSEVTVGAAERGQSRPRLDTLRKFSRVLGPGVGSLGLLTAITKRAWPRPPEAGTTWRARDYPSLTLTAMGAVLARLRMNHQLSLRDLARATGLPSSLLRSYELGATVPRVSSLAKICRVYGVGWAALEALAATIFVSLRGRSRDDVEPADKPRAPSAPAAVLSSPARAHRRARVAWRAVARMTAFLDLADLVSRPIAGEIGPPEDGALAVWQAFGRRLRAARTALGLTLEQAGARIGMSFSQFWFYENGRRFPQPRTVRRLAKAVQLAPPALLPCRPPKIRAPEKGGATWADAARRELSSASTEEYCPRHADSTATALQQFWAEVLAPRVQLSRPPEGRRVS